MKIRLSHVLSLLLCLAMVAAAVCIGAVRGWQDERAAAVAAVLADPETSAALTDRALDLHNLTVVAARHLSETDGDLTALRDAASVLCSGPDDLSAFLAAHELITSSVPGFAERLLALPGVQASTRDRALIRSLAASLSSDPGLQHKCHLAFSDFNSRIRGSLTGKLAMCLGVTPLEVGQAIPAEISAAAPRFPESAGFLTDAAAVLVADTGRDLDTLNKRLRDAGMIQSRGETSALPAVYVVTVDFLDGASASDYARILRERWALDAGDLLLLIAAGQDEYLLSVGSSPLSRTTLNLMTDETFRESFLKQQYDGAVAALLPRLIAEVNDAWQTDIQISDLFGQQERHSIPDWASGLFGSERTGDAAGIRILSAGSRIAPFLSVLLIVGAMLLFFGSFTGRRSPRRSAPRTSRRGRKRPPAGKPHFGGRHRR